MKLQLHRTWSLLADFLLRHSWPVLGALVLSAAGSLVLATQLRFDFTPQAIYSGNDDLLEYAEQFKETFGYDEAVALVVLEATGPADVLDPPGLQWQAEIAADFRAIPSVMKVESLATLQVPRLTLTGFQLHPLIERMPVDQDSADQVRSLLAGMPLPRNGMLNRDDRVAAVPVFLDPAGRDIDAMRETVAAISAAVARRPAPDGYRVHFTGLPVLRVEIVNALRSDLLRMFPLAGVAYLAVLGLLFRRISGALLPLMAVGIGLTWTMATLAVTRETLNLVSNILPVLLLIIGVSSCVQIVSCYAEESANGLRDQRKAARDAIARMAPACLLAAITTAVGFASLSTARSVLLQRFGWQAAVGVAYQYISTLVTLGTVFRFFPPPRYVGLNETRPGLITRMVTAAGFAVACHPWWTLACALGVVAVMVWSGSRVIINSYAVLETFDSEHPSIQSLRLVERELAGIMPLEISLQSHETGHFLEPEVFHKVLEVEEAARGLPGVLAVQSYADLFREVLSRWPGRRRSETDRQLVPSGNPGRARLERTARFIERFPDAFHYETYMTEDGRRARIRVRLREIGTRETLALIGVLEARLATAFPPGGPIEARLTGEAYVNAQALSTLIRDLFYSLLTASFVIFSLIAIKFRSLRVGLIAALPNLTPLTLTLGYMGFRGYDMNVGNVIAFTICLGLADDNTIYFLYRFRDEVEADGNVVAAIRRAFLSTGRAIVATNLLLVVGMSVLMFSNFVPTRRFGELTEVTILGNLFGVMLLLPACLVLFWKAPRKKSPEAGTTP